MGKGNMRKNDGIRRQESLHGILLNDKVANERRIA